MGISTAICSGGYGAVFWMWVIAIIGGASAFIESTLAQIYKRRDPETGDSYGGPAYYIEAALKNRALAVIFCICLILTYAGGFNMLASYNLQSTFSGYSFYNKQTTPWIIGAVLAVIVLYCLLGGGRRVTRVAAVIVPVMGVAYVLLSLLVVVLHIGLAWDVADVTMGFMAIINLPVIVILGGTALAALNDYAKQKNEGKNPVFKASSIGLKDKTEYWK